jgi:hypothetical protein
VKIHLAEAGEVFREALVHPKVCRHLRVIEIEIMDLFRVYIQLGEDMEEFVRDGMVQSIGLHLIAKSGGGGTVMFQCPLPLGIVLLQNTLVDRHRVFFYFHLVIHDVHQVEANGHCFLAAGATGFGGGARGLQAN